MLALTSLCVANAFDSFAQQQSSIPPDPPAQPAPQATDSSLLEKVFTESLKPEQIIPLGKKPTPEQLAAAMTPEQKDGARRKLKEVEEHTSDTGELDQIARGYALLNASADVFRVAMRRQGLLPQDSHDLSVAASAAYSQGHTEQALRLVAEALARNPEDQQARDLALLMTPKTIGANLKLQDPFKGAAAENGADTTPVAGGKGATQRSPSPAAGAAMRQAIQARRAGDMTQTLKSALDAMRADPTNPTVQEFYGFVIKDRTKQMRRLQQTMSYLDQAVDAENAGHGNVALAFAEKALASGPSSPVLDKFLADLRARAAQKPAAAPAQKTSPSSAGKLPPVVPIGTGGLLLALGTLLWRSGGQEKAEAWWADTKRTAAMGMIGIGVAGMIYGGGAMIGAFTPTPALALASGGTAGAAVVVDGAAIGQGTAITAASAKLASTGLSLSKSQSQGEATTSGANQAKPEPTPDTAGKIRTLLLPDGKPIGESGTSLNIRVIKGNATDAERLFTELSSGGEDVTPSDHVGRLVKLPGDRYVGFRPVSASGPPTIDVNAPETKGIVDKIKFIP